MNAENELPSEPLVLDVDLSAVETQKPTLKAGLVPATIISAGVQPNKDGTGRNLVVVFATDHPEVSTTGKPINPGFKLTKYCHLQNKPGANDPNQWMQNIAELQEAATGSKAGQFNSQAIIGAHVILNVTIEENQGQPSNAVRRVQKAV